MWRRPGIAILLLLAVVASLAAEQARGPLAVSANDAKVVLVEGVTTVVRNPPPDTVTVIDLGTSPPKVLGEVRAPASIVGPPSSVAIAPDGSIALVTASMKIDPADPTRTIPDDVVSVIDLTAAAPAVLATLHAGAGANGVAINPAGTLALVANRTVGTVSVFTIAGKTVRAAGTVDLGAPDSWPSGVIFTPDGRRAFVTRNNDHLVSVLAMDGAKVEYTKVSFAAGLRPYGIDLTPAGDLAIVANTGAGATGGADTLSVIDLTVEPPRAISHVTVGPTAEHLALSPDGRHVAVTVMNGTNLLKSSPFFHESGWLRIFRLTNRVLQPLTEARVGRWCQGTAWSPDSRTILVQCAADREILVFGFNGQTLRPAGAIKVDGGPVGIRTTAR